MICRVCYQIILATESCTSINNDHYHGRCFDRQAAKREKPDRCPADDHRTEPLHEGDVLGRFRAGLLVDTGTVFEVITGVGRAQTEKILWARGIEQQTGDDVRRIPL
jgi:hypothetical protein